MGSPLTQGIPYQQEQAWAKVQRLAAVPTLPQTSQEFMGWARAARGGHQARRSIRRTECNHSSDTPCSAASERRSNMAGPLTYASRSRSAGRETQWGEFLHSGIALCHALAG